MQPTSPPRNPYAAPGSEGNTFTRGRAGSVLLDQRPFIKGRNVSACLRSGRWLRAGDFARDKVQSRGVLLLGLMCTLSFIVLLTISDTSFLYPTSYARNGSPDLQYTSLHCILPTDTNSTSDILDLVSLIGELVTSPASATGISKCQTRWASMDVVAIGGGIAAVPLDPAPVWRVVDKDLRGVPDVEVTALVSYASGASGNWSAPVPFSALTSNGGYASFDGTGLSLNTADARLGVAVKVAFQCDTLECGVGSLLGAAFPSQIVDAVVTVVSSPDPHGIPAGGSFELTVQLTSADGSVVYPSAAVALNWAYLSDAAVLYPMPQVAFTNATGFASFVVRVVSAHSNASMTLYFASIAPVPTLWTFWLRSSTVALVPKVPPTDIYLAGTNATGSLTDAYQLYVEFLPRQEFVPDVVICITPPFSNHLIKATPKAITGIAPGTSLNGLTDISFLDTPTNMVVATLNGDTAVTAFTDDTGCATFPKLMFTDGSNGMYAIEWTSDDVVAYTGPHVLVNYRVPDFAAMSFIGGSGPLVQLWLFMSIVFAVLLMCGNKHHDFASRVVMAGALLGCVIGIIAFAFTEAGVFVAGFGLSSVNYVTSCCDFAQVSFTSSFLALLLFFCTLALFLLFVVFAVRAYRHTPAGGSCGRRKAGGTAYTAPTVQTPVFRAGDTSRGSFDSLDAGGFDNADERAEYRAMVDTDARMTRSESVSSIGSEVPRSVRESWRFRLRQLCKAAIASAHNAWFMLAHSAFFSEVSHDESRRLRYRILVQKLLAPSKRKNTKVTIQDKLQKMSIVRSWADRSETVVALRSTFTVWMEFVVAVMWLFYAILVEPWWSYLVNRCRLRQSRLFVALKAAGTAALQESAPESGDPLSPVVGPTTGTMSSVGPSGMSSPLSAAREPFLATNVVDYEEARPVKQSVRALLRLYASRVLCRAKVVMLLILPLILKTTSGLLVIGKQFVIFLKQSRERRNPFKKFETWNDFYFSQRILTAMITSMFLCAIVAVFLCVLVAWMVSYMYAAMTQYEDAIDQIHLRLVWPPGESRWTVVSHAVFIGMGFLVTQLKEVIGHGTFNLVFQDIVPPAVGALATITWLSMLVTWGFILNSYRVAILEGRRGKWKVEPESVNVFNATRYIGYQSVHCLVGYFGIFVFLFLTILAVVLLFVIKPLLPLLKLYIEQNLFNIRGTLFQLIFPLIVQQIVRMLLVNPRNEIRNMILFSIADFSFLVLNFIIGTLVVIKRSLLLIVGMLLSFWRLDLEWISIDSGHAAWCAMLLLDCRQNNPVLITFCDLVFRDINTRRKMLGKRPHIDEDYISCPIPLCCCVPCVPALRVCTSTRGAGVCYASDRSVFDDREYEEVMVNPALARTQSNAQFNPIAKALSARKSSWAAVGVEEGRAPLPAGVELPSVAASRASFVGVFVDDFGRIRHDDRCRYIRRQQIINRWWLYLVMTKNPILLRYRKQAASGDLLPRVFASRATLYGTMERSVMVIGKRALKYKKCFVVLRLGFLVFYTSTQSRVPSGTLDIADIVSMSAVDGESAVLELELSVKPIRLRFKSSDDMKTWQDAIGQVWERPNAATAEPEGPGVP